MKTRLLVIGVDAATWKIIEPNLDKFPTIRKLIRDKKNNFGTIKLKESPKSPSVWCSMFSGKTPDEHGHHDFFQDGKVRTRDDINVKFIWDIIGNKIDIRVLQVPFVYPPYNFNCQYTPPSSGLITDLEELSDNAFDKFELSKHILSQGPDVFITVFTCLDQLSHFHWGEPIIIEWYRTIDMMIGELIELADKSIIISDHGFGDWKDSKVHTLPEKTQEGKEIKGDHHDEAIFITKGIKESFIKPQDVFNYIKREFK